MLYSITSANIQHYHLTLIIIHMGKQILWYCDRKRNAICENTSSFWRQSRLYLAESWKTCIWILNILPNPTWVTPIASTMCKTLHLYSAYTFKKNILRHLMAKNTVTKWYGVIFFYIDTTSLLIMGNTHPNHPGLYWCINPNHVSEKK